MNALRLCVYGLAVVGFCLLAGFTVHGNPLPYSDEWHLIPHLVDGITWDDARWLLHPHGDHQIGILKIYYSVVFAILPLDFRVVKSMNSIFLFVGCFYFMHTLGKIRKYRMGDLAIPLILLNPGYPPSFSGFSFQFMSSTLLLLGFCSAAFKTKMTPPPPPPPRLHPLLLAAGCILINTFCGVNGTVVSFFIALAWLVCFRWIEPETSTQVGWGIRTTLSIVVISTVWILINWRPSGASTTSLSVTFTQLPNIASAFLVLLNPTPMVIPAEFHTIYTIFNLLLIATATGVLFRRALSRSRNRRVAIADFSLLTSLGATIVMLLSVAVGRAEYWTSGLERHYGILGIVLAVVSWTTISLHMRRIMVQIVGSLFLCVNLYLYVVNFEWRATQTNRIITNTVDLYGDISKGIVIDRFVENHIRKLFYVDTPRARKIVRDNIRLLRKNEIAPYTFLSDGVGQPGRRD